MILSGTATIRSLRLRGRPGRAACCAATSLLLGAILLFGTQPPASAQTREELRAALQRLRQVEGSLEPLPNTGIARDVGQIAIVEHDGSNYDARLPDETLNYEARTRVGLTFYETHADAYDFLVVFTNFPFETSDATAFHLFGRNDVEGIGKPVNSPPAVFGSPARLKGWIDMADVSQYRQRPFSVTPGDLGFRQTLNVLAHEVGHQWLAEATYNRDGATQRDLLGRDGNHWSYLLDSDASLFYGADWRDNGDGTFTAARVKEAYSALDLYLMGFLPREKVPPLLLLQNPAIDTTAINREGEVVTTTGTTEILIDQLIEDMGTRRPDSVHSQKEFRLGFVFLTKPETEPSPEDLEAVERVRRAFGAHFFALTHGVAWADTTLVETPGGPRAAVPDLQRALAWLATQQGLDGSWSDSAETRPRDTAASVWALVTAGAPGAAWQRGAAWLQQAQPESLDFRARLASALGPGALGAAEKAARVAKLLSFQNADGGFGAGADFASDALDTALALRALRALDCAEDGPVRLAVSALSGLANTDGGWPAVAGGETSTVATAEVLLALLDWSDVSGSAALRGTGLAALLARQNPDRGFGSSPSTPHASALALEVLLRSGAPADVVGPLTAWLEANQLADGSWAASPYQTALVLAALRQSLGANLVVPAASLFVNPSPAEEGQLVQVTSRVRNDGREAAPATVARLYDGDPASSPSIAEAAVSAIAPGEEAEVAFSYPTRDRAGVRTLYVVADAAGAVAESREDDNTASRALTVVGKMADIVVRPEDVVVSPAGPEVGEAATITVTVHNVGQRAAGVSSVLVTVSDPAGASIALPLASLPALAPGESAPVAVPWSPAVAGTHVLQALADAGYEVPESDETNNVGERAARAIDRAPEGADLAVVSPELAPDTLTELPQEIVVHALVENRGRAPAASTVAVREWSSWGPMLGTVPVQIDPRSSVPVAIPVTITTPGVRPLVAVADPDGQIPEDDETDNLASVSLADARTLDLDLVADSVTASSLDVVSGETVTVTFDVRNRGTTDVPLVPVQLANAATGLELARADFDVPAGQVRNATLAWRTQVSGEIPLLLRVDPFDLLREKAEDNNQATLDLTVRPSGLPNLSVSGADVAFAPDPPVEGDTADVSALVRNVGVVPAGPFAVRFYVGDPEKDGTLIGESLVGGLGPESSATVSVTWSPVNARGTLGAFVVVDSLAQVEESDESDNRAFRPFQATGLPDLVLTAADVVLDPGYPRVGEEVTVRAIVRNLGGQPSGATSLRVVEGERDFGTPVGVLPVPELAAGSFVALSLSWTPSSPPGERPLRLEVDPDGLVVEQDEGNNASRRAVVVQDADLYLTEPYFSPDGDGVKDQTTLAWRATGRVAVVVSSARGNVVKTLTGDGPASGSATWDGRDERGVVTWDGTYTLTLTGEGGRELGRALVDLDTNRSPIHDAHGPAETSIRNLTCSLPPSPVGPAWMPSEEEVLFISKHTQPALMRVGLDGSHAPVVQDAWYSNAYFAGDAPVSPDGREVLLMDQPYSWLGGSLVAVDLATGSRRTLSDTAGSASWSPDGRFIVNGDTVLERDGTVVADLCDGWECPSEWVWSPASDRLAGSNGLHVDIVARDGTVLDGIDLPWDDGRDFEYAYSLGVVWRGDGKIVARVEIVIQDDREYEHAVYVVDPETGTAKRALADGSWSPDGSRALDGNGSLWLEDGTSLGILIPGGATVSPRSSAGSYVKHSSDERPGSVCGGKAADTFVVSTLANLTAQLDLARLPGNTGLLVKGTAADRNLDRFQLEFASRDDPATWHPIGPASDVPVVDDILAAWVPPTPGTYGLRLSVSDRAGNSRELTRVVSTDRIPALANFTQTEHFLSPNGDGVKDEVTFRYLVLEPTRLDVRIVGPEPAGPAAPAAREVRRLSFEYPVAGPQSFTWAGRDAADEVVPDGRYTVYLNDLPFRIELDNTPPEVALQYLNPRVRPEVYKVRPGALDQCRKIETLIDPIHDPAVELASVVGDQSWHVVDRHLKSWILRSPAHDMSRGTDPVYVPETDASGMPVLDAGVPRVRREAGRPVDRKDERGHFQSLAAHPVYTLLAEDLAGNRSEVSAPPPAEGVWMLGAVFEEAGYGCKAFPVSPGAEDVTEETVAGLRPENGAFLAGASLYPPAEAENVRFSFQPLKGGPWTEVALRGRTSEGLWHLPIDSFESIGVDPTAAYRGRFLGHGDGGEIQSESFTFRPCEEWIQTHSFASPDPPGVVITLGAKLHVPLTWARAHVWRKSVDSAAETDLGYFAMWPEPAIDGTQVFWVLLPPSDCTSPYRYVVEAQDANGRRYANREFVKACQRLAGTHPGPCQFAVKVEQRFPGCGGSPDDLHLRAYLLADEPVFLEVQAGPEGSVVAAPPLPIPLAKPTPYGWPYRDFVLDAKAWPDSAVPARASLRRQSNGDVVASHEIPAYIDRTPPLGDVLVPPEGSTACAAGSLAGSSVMDVLALGTDVSPELGVQALLRSPDGTSETLARVCPAYDLACRKDPKKAPSGRAVNLGWDVTRFDSGAYELQLQLCDRSGNASMTPRHFYLTREPPGLWIQGVSNPIFSPNSDGRVEDTIVVARLAGAASLTAEVRSGDAKGPLVRTLFAERPASATDVPATWDGRTDAGAVAPDGAYLVVFRAADACGGGREIATSVEVDTTPPEVEITQPAGGQRVSASVDVLGRATDLHFAEWTLDVSCGGSPEWTVLATRTYPVGPGSFLARWDTARAPPGECRLRLVAEDRAENRSPEAFATATVERGDLLEGLSATPEVFSPNGDGRRETSTLGYALARAARVRLEVRSQAGLAVRTLETGELREGGSWSHLWDGLDDSGKPAEEGIHVLWARAEDPEVATVYEETAIRLDLDRTPPMVTVSRPMPDGFVAPTSTVRGSVSDRNLASFTVSAAPAGTPLVELVRGSRGFSDERDLAPLSSLTEGPHVLSVFASDVAENETRIDRPFLVDATPPRATIQSPVTGAVLRRGDTPIPVTGLVLDDHLEQWTLRFGAGPEPATFTAIGQGETGGQALSLGAWDVRFVPDGVYTLSLVATDRAGLSTESRVTVTLDGAPPTVALTSPVGGGYVTAPAPIVGTAADTNIASWELESAPGDAATAYQWMPLASGSRSVSNGALGEWSPLPPDGVYTLRLTARDQVELSASTQATVTVDTTPPAMPTGLEAKVTRASEGYGRVAVTWNANTEPDLAGYRIERPREEWGADLLESPAWADGERVEGRYTYRVLAEDKAGNQSPAATLVVLVDLTPPLVSFSFPAEGEPVAGAVDVRGTAWSADDFAEYRLFVGAGDSPAEWRALRRSSVPVASGTLGEWLALTDGPYTLALEAEDTNGNEARVTRRVVVDTLPPEPPVLLVVAKEPPPADWLVPSWQPSPSTDVIGTLVYRNGRLANSTTVVIGDRRGFVVPGTSYEDEGLPDGEHCYRVSAMDGAGNESVLSNEICESLDNRAPRAVIVNPPDGARFGFPVRAVAETPDLDVASVRFERRVPGGSWVGFGEIRSAPPWETTLDPDPPGGTPLAAGPHELRAVATDRTGNTDPDPARITVVYGDTTPPPAPTGLVARVDGYDVALTWTAVDVPDFGSYRVYRDGEPIAAGVIDPHHADLGRAPGTYEYLVTALDADGNESAPSAPATATVYVVRLDQPAWPVVPTSFGSVTGDGSRPQTTVKVLRATAAVAEGASAGGPFRVDGVPLVPDGNLLQARGEDAAGNRSVPSNEIVLISNTPPAPVSGLDAQVDGTSVSLQWAPVPDADLVGYVVRRDGERLTGTTPQTEAASFDATSGYWSAPWAFDGDPSTAWVPESLGGEAWTVTFPLPVFVEQVRLRFAQPDGSNPGIAADYTLLARWQDRDLPLVRVRGNKQLVAEHRLPAPFQTTALRVALDSPGGLAEVTVERLDVVPAGTEAFADDGVPDGRHAYEVSAIDWYGAEGPAGTVEAAVGDVDPPGRPAGLVATPIVRDVHLTWNPNPEPDVTHYVVLRDASRIGTAPTASYVDPGRPNGTYRYAVIAVDAAGHESEESDPADATVDVQPVPPAAPVILEPTDAAHPITLDTSRSDVAGRADAGTVVALEVDGQPRGTAEAGPGFRPSARVALGAGYGVALSPDGKWAAWGEVAGAVSVQDLATGEIRLVPHGGDGSAEPLAFSPDGSALALARQQAAPPYLHEVALLRLDDGSASVPMAGSWVPDGAAWSPDGTQLAVSLQEPGGGSLHVVDMTTGVATERARSSGVDTHLRWSPDGSRIAFIRNWGWGVAAELQVLDLGSSHTRVLDPQPSAYHPPSWSADGRRLAWTTAGAQPLRVRVQDVELEHPPTDLTELGSDAVDARFSPDGDWLSFVRLTHLPEGTTLRSVRALRQLDGLRVAVSEPQEAYGLPDIHEWLGGRLAIRVGDQLSLHVPEAGRFVIRDVPLVPGENRLVARATDPATGLESPDSETVLVTVPEGAFPDLAVVPEGILSVPPVPLVAQPIQLRLRVDNRGDVDSGETEVLVRVVDPAGAAAVDSRATLPAVAAGREAWVLLPWTPAATGRYAVHVEVDPDGRIAEISEANNAAERFVTVVAQEGLAAEVASDHASYPSLSTAHVTVRVVNAGTPFSGLARTTVEDAAGGEVALLDERAVSLEWGKSVSFALEWSTGTTPAGPYAFRVRVRATGATEPSASAERPFAIEPGLRVLARVRPEPLAVAEGTAAAFVLGVENQSTNVTLDGATARLRLRPEGTSGPATFETVRALPSLPTGGSWAATDVWPVAQPAGRYAILFEVTKDDTVLASASAILTVEPASPLIRGTLAVEPGHVLSGEAAEALLGVENQGTASVSGYPLAVELVSGAEATVHLSVPASVDLAAGESRPLTLSIPSGGIAPGPYVVRLRGGARPVTLDRSRLVVHGLIAPPSPHEPAEGARVDTAHPPLVVNNASSPEGAALTYEFELYGDEQLTQLLPGVRGVPETPSRTSWAVAAGLAEDTTYWWRARATDDFSTSAWSAVASFTVDAANRPPSAPVPDTPVPGARVASRQPELIVRNAIDPERQPLTYEFRLAADEDMSEVVAAQAGVAEGLGATSWTVTTLLDEDVTYYWMARARTAGNTPEDFSPWTVPVPFRVDTVNSSPTAPVPLRPIGGAEVTTHTPALVVANASDPEGDPLTYRFEIDTQPELGSPDLQMSPELAPGAVETEWTPPAALRENTTYYWRAHASDGNTATPSGLAHFFVDAANEAPGACVPLDPVDGRTVGTSTPILRLRNAEDPEGDALTYAFEVRDASDAVVASAVEVPAGTDETTWTVTSPLGEDQAFTWSARASDGELQGPWSDPEPFRVNAVLEPPTAPVPLLPADEAVVEDRRPALVVENATSPEGLPLTYTFELDAVSADGSTSPVARGEAVPEGQGTTEWTPSIDLADGQYQWRARASDPQREGPWSATWHFQVFVDPPPAPPTGLIATAGDARVRLDWNENTELDLTGYRVYRSTTAGGPHVLVATVATNRHDDLGLTNGVTYYYVVTATDAHAESEPSNEAAARPEAPQALVAEVRYDPAVVRAECLIAGDDDDEDDDEEEDDDRNGAAASAVDKSCHPDDCPDRLLATLELPSGYDPATIEVASLRLFGSVPADPGYKKVVDVDHDGLRELQVRFDFGTVASHLAVGVNSATIVGRAGASEVRGTGTIEVLALSADLRVTPRTLERRSKGQEVLARVTFAEGVSASQVSIPSVRLNGVVPVERVIHAKRRELLLKFDRAAVIGVLPLGSSVEVRVTGTLQGVPFKGIDHIRVIE